MSTGPSFDGAVAPPLALLSEPTTPTSIIHPIPAANITPPVFKDNNYGSKFIPAERRYRRLAKQLSGTYLGPMKVQDFFARFMPCKAKFLAKMPTIPDKLFHTVRGSEVDMYDAFIRIVNELRLMPGIKLVVTAASSDRNSHKSNKIKSDVAGYKLCVQLAISPTQYRYIEIQFEFKTHPEMDPLVHLTKDAEKNPFVEEVWEAQTLERERNRGQSASYIAEQYQHQHRCFLFSVVIAGDTVRFYRWDRAGVIATERIDYHAQPKIFCEFLWRFAHMTDIQRGWDPTVRPANKRESRAAEKNLADWGDTKDKMYPKYVLWVPVDELPGPSSEQFTGRVYHARKIKPAKSGPPADGRGYRKFIAWRPLAMSKSPTGRATYGYPVWELNDRGCGKPMFLKGTWRTNGKDLETEGTILKRLNENGVQHVPLFVCGGHLAGPGQSTQTQAYSKVLENGKAYGRKHYRFVEAIVAYPIMCFSDSHQMMTAIFHAFVAHKEAYEKCNVLHRDISIGNIMITPDGRGILNDWDLARSVDATSRARQAERTGTWQFMSNTLLREPGKLHTIQDDMESFIHVVLYLGLIHLRHNKQDIDPFMSKYFDDYDPLNRIPGLPITGGGQKQGFFRNFEFEEPLKFDCEPMTIFFSLVRPWVDSWLRATSVNPGHDEATAALSKSQQFMGRYQGKGVLPPQRLSPSQNMNVDNLAWKDHQALYEMWKDLLEELPWPDGVDKVPDQRQNAPFSAPRESWMSSRQFQSVRDPAESIQSMPGPHSMQKMQQPTPSSFRSAESSASGKRTRDDAQLADGEWETADEVAQDVLPRVLRRSMRNKGKAASVQKTPMQKQKRRRAYK